MMFELPNVKLISFESIEMHAEAVGPGGNNGTISGVEGDN